MTSSAMTRALILPEVLLRKARLLPCDGTVTVKVGDLVRPQDVVATAQKQSAPLVLMVGQALGVPTKNVARMVVRWAGESVHRDEILAEKKGLFGLGRRVFRSPCDGVVISGPHSQGEVVVGRNDPEMELRAGIGGRVVATVPYRGAVVEVLASYVQGIGGYGVEVAGTLRLAVATPEAEITPGSIDETSAGSILVGGRIGQEGLMQAVRAGVAGIVAGAISGEGYRWLRSTSPRITVMVTACGGGGVMSQGTFGLLRQRAELPALLNGEPRAEAPSELIVTLGGVQKAAGIPHTAMAVGAPVRIVAGSLAGQAGRLSRLPVNGRLLPSGISAAMADVRLEDGQIVSVPRANLIVECR